MQNGETPVLLFGDDSASVFLLRWRDFVATTVCPGEVMYARRTIFDLVLPRIIAGEMLRGADFARLGQGGLCLDCEMCTFPNCGFGK